MPQGIGWFPLAALAVTIALVLLTRRKNNNNNNDKRG